MKDGGLDAFTAEVNPIYQTSSSIKKTDVVPEFMETLTALGQALNQIENPTKARSELLLDTAGPINSVFNAMLNTRPTSNGTAYANIRNLNVESFVFHDGAQSEFANIKSLIPGMNLLGTSIWKPAASANSLQQLISFLYCFIAQLDLSTGLTGESVILFLQKNDTVNFGRLVKETVDMFDNKYYDDSSKLLLATNQKTNGLIKSLGSVADDIIKELVTRSSVSSTNEIVNTDSNSGTAANYDFTDAETSLKAFLDPTVQASLQPAKTGFGIPAMAAALTAIADKLVSRDVGSIPNTIKPVFNDDNLAVKIARHGYLNAPFFNGTAEKITNKNEATISSAVVVGGQLSEIDYKPIVTAWLIKYNLTTLVPGYALMNTADIKQKITDLSNGTQVTSSGNKKKAADALPLLQSQIAVPSAGLANSAPLFLYSPVAGPPPETTYSRIDKPLTGTATDLLVTEIPGINDFIRGIKQFQSPDYTFSKIALVALLDALVSNTGNLAKDQKNNAPKYAAIIHDSIEKYKNYVASRIPYVNTKINTSGINNTTLAFKDKLINGFFSDLRGSVPSESNKQNMSSGTCQRRIYDEVLWGHFDEYDQIFNLLKGEQPVKNLDAIQKNIDALSTADKNNKVTKDAQYAGYRLNVKKIPRYGMIGGRRRMHGGDGEIDVINALDGVPAITAGSQRIIWLTETERITEDELFNNNGGQFALRRLAQEIFTSDPANDDVTVSRPSGGDVTLNKAVAAKNIVKILGDKIFNLSPNDIMSVLNNNAKNAPSVSKKMVQDEKDLKAYMLANGEPKWQLNADRSDWEIPGKDFNIEDQCGFIDDATAPGCVSFLNECGLEQGTFAGCYEVVKKIDKNKQWASVTNKETITKISPRVAYNILKHFNFDTITAKDANSSSPFANIDLIKMEPLSSWYKRLDTTDLQNKFKPKNGDTSEEAVQIMKDNKYFLSYLSLLVEWVNAHPSLLNKGWVTTPKTEGPKDEHYNFIKDFRPYEYYPSNKAVGAKNGANLQMLLRGLTQLGGNYRDGMYAYKRRAMFNDMKRNSGRDIEMPFNRGMFDRDMPQNGGGDVYKFLEGPSKEGSATFLKNLYNQIAKMLQDQRKIDLSEPSKSNLDKILDKISVAEKEANEWLLKAIKRQQIKNITNGRIDIEQVANDDELKKIEEMYLSKTKEVERSSEKYINSLVTMLTLTINGRK